MEVGCIREATKKFFGCPLRKKDFLLFVAVLLTTKPRGGGLKALVDCQLRKKVFVAVSLTNLIVWGLHTHTPIKLKMKYTPQRASFYITSLN